MNNHLLFYLIIIFVGVLSVLFSNHLIYYFNLISKRLKRDKYG